MHTYYVFTYVYAIALQRKEVISVYAKPGKVFF